MPVESLPEQTQDVALRAEVDRYVSPFDRARLHRSGVSDSEIDRAVQPRLSEYRDARITSYLGPLTANFLNTVFRERISAARPVNPLTVMPRQESRSAIIGKLREVKTLFRAKPKGAKNAA